MLRTLRVQDCRNAHFFESDEIEELSQHVELPSSNGHGGHDSRDLLTSSVRLGHAIQGQDCDHSRRGHHPDKDSSNGSAGVVRNGAESGLEAFVPNNPNEFMSKGFTSRPPSVESHPQSGLEVSHGSSQSFVGKGGGAEQAAKAISFAPLGRIKVACARKEVGRLQGDGLGSLGEPSHLEANPINGSNSEMRCASVLQRGHTGYTEVYDGVETGLGGFEGHSREDRLECGGDSHDEC